MELDNTNWLKSCESMCRLCLERNGFLLAIFDKNTSYTEHQKGGTRLNSIYKKITELINLEIDSDDSLPKGICHRCLYKVELCSEFKQQCLRAEATLRQVTSNVRQNSTDKSDSQLNLSKIVDNDQFERFSLQNQDLQIENVVMVVDPNQEYETDAESDQEVEFEPEAERHSDIENENVADLTELKNVFMCTYCDRAFVDYDSCYTHETETHDPESPYTCRDCDMVFADRMNHTAHLKSVHKNDKPFGCPECERSFSRRSDLRKHTVVHTGIKPFTCTICSKSFSRNTNLTKHLRIHSGHKPYVCAQCPRTFISKGDLTRHGLIHSGVKPFACSHCDQCFGRRDKLIRHEKRHFQQDGGDVQDDFSSELSLLRHHLLHGDEYQCDRDIKEEIMDSWDTSENMVISVDPFNGGEHQNMEEHEEEHGQEYRPYPEHVTGDSDYQSNVPVAPKPKKQSVKNFACNTCPKRFTSPDTLRLHMAVHSGLRPFECNLCPKTFLRKRELDRHITTHTGMKPFECSSCDKKFGRKDKLVRHMRVHDINKLLNCEYCPASFRRKDGLMHHMKSHFQKEEMYQENQVEPYVYSEENNC